MRPGLLPPGKRLDVAGLLLAAGLTAIALWLLAQREWTGIVGLVFPLWWGWQVISDRTIALNLRAPEPEPSGRPPDVSRDASPLVCCFCGEAADDSADSCHLELWSPSLEWEVHVCHGTCFKARVIDSARNTAPSN